MTDLPDLDAMNAEHEAWTDVVREWRALDLPDFNSEPVSPLIRAIELWGERLVALRRTQPDDQAAKALAGRIQAYRAQAQG